MRIILSIFAVIIFHLPAWGSERSVIFYLDGAIVTNEYKAIQESMEIQLPSSYKIGTLRIRPLDGCRIEHIDEVYDKPDPRTEKQIAQLMEKRGVLTDRLKTLEFKESIFKSAAKSQSGRALRKTKSNPDPLTSVRQQTEYAMSQLEGVYRARRASEAELKSIDERLQRMKKGESAGIATARLSGKGCRMSVSYQRSDLKWHANYDFRLENAGEAEVLIHAIIPRIEKGTDAKVVPAMLNEPDGTGTEWPILYTSNNLVKSLRFPVEQENYSTKPVSSITFRMKNQSEISLPAGEASCYYRGEYLGKASFQGSGPGESKEIGFGK